jgi:hypothetical protein
LANSKLEGEGIIKEELGFFYYEKFERTEDFKFSWQKTENLKELMEENQKDLEALELMLKK